MGNYIISKQLHRNIWRAMYLDTLSGSLLLNCQNTNERDILKHFQTISCLRHLIDEVQDPPLLVLERLDGNLLIESGTNLQSSEVKHVAKAVIQALALHEEVIVHTVAWKTMVTTSTMVTVEAASAMSNWRTAGIAHTSISVLEEHTIGATIFWSPEAMLNLFWGPPP